ncbi:MAG: flagellar hook-length control protein FliK [Peptostreptococcaceae bacterium]|nr:flagellar hook-length control protein FliK [Peptostreptococcaceae bacterium]
MKIEKITAKQVQEKRHSKEAGSKFKDMMQALEGSTSKEAKNDKEAVSKEAELKGEVKNDKDVESKEADHKIKSEGTVENKINGLAQVNEEIDVQAIVKEDKSISKKANIKEDEQGSKIEAEQLTNIPMQVVVGSRAYAIKEKNETMLSEQKDPMEDPLGKTELHKQLDNAWMLKPQIKEMSMEAKDINSLQREIELKTGEEVDISFRKQIDPKEGSAEIQEENIQIIQGSKLQGSETREVEKISIKVAEPQDIAPKVIEKLQEKIEILQTGEKSYEIEMDPENLGKIHVKIHFGEKGTALEMVFSEKKTMELMARHLEQMSETLQSNRELPIDIRMSEGTPSDYLDQQQQRQQEQQQREEQRKSEEFINQMKQAIAEQDIA